MDDNKIKDDDIIDYSILSQHLKEDTDRKKKSFANEITKFGDEYLKDIEVKKAKYALEKEKLITSILKYKNHSYERSTLDSYNNHELKIVLDDVIFLNKPFYVKLFRFIFNL